MSKTKIKIDHTKCRTDGGIDARECSKCLYVCDPAVFLCHQDLDLIIKEKNQQDSQFWKITVFWSSVYSPSLKCAKLCPENAISVIW